ncbi:uncharacterized protein Z520_08874 [Fonsecaea multimorphosa CBS 102226]|uniref:BPL/LPL catalytic domain-containing protein n=1 Tax=Fonsecaea multimorphosa CBS 102226 TaxID=1442371 RepID=A0A0D2JPR8_9EURO|nr:uncharacterized protein Z520_08874 [Fonsecaea multimorphosa CBS 102226]KIX95357.1 hypothetical protein Z520_08874 [Fonsecaea multimorphosa CBS 102226]OAL21026.1 hypothetical protein AYO22_08310 [Fonsecaea multimorphosa]
MRLAHLHIPGLVPYTHSLRLQTAILERHFQHKDWLRSATRDDAAARGARPIEATNNAPPPTFNDRGKDPASRLSPRIFDRTASDTVAAADADEVDEVDDAARPRTSQRRDVLSLRHDRPESLLLGARNGNCTTKDTTAALQHNARSVPPFHAGSSPWTLSHVQTPPDPVLLTFSTPPTYTVGRRHLLANPISADQRSFLSANGLATFHASPRGGLLTYHAPGQLTGYVIVDLRRFGITARCWVKLLEESVMRTCSRWGVLTGRTDDPGVWVLDPGRAIDQQSSVQAASTLAKGAAAAAAATASDRKICAIGVQVSRGITSHGVGLNVYDAPLPSASPSSASPSADLSLSPSPTSPSTSASPSGTVLSSGEIYDFIPAQVSSPSYDQSTRGYLSWGFSRIVACGLEGKSVTWLTREMSRLHHPSAPGDSEPIRRGTSSLLLPADIPARGESRREDDQTGPLTAEPIAMESVADVFAREIVHGLNIMKAEGKETVDGVYRIQESDIL